LGRVGDVRVNTFRCGGVFKVSENFMMGQSKKLIAKNK
jgi:hypothetical protein